jgi:hypothetical protein
MTPDFEPFVTAIAPKSSPQTEVFSIHPKTMRQIFRREPEGILQVAA